MAPQNRNERPEGDDLDSQLLWRIEELAYAANVSRRTIERAIRNGEIRTMRLGPRIVRIHRNDAQLYLRGCSAGG